MLLIEYLDDVALTSWVLFSGAMLGVIVVAWITTLFPPRR